MLLFGTKARDVFKAWAKKDKQAQIEGTKRLGLPENNTAADRAKAMGFYDVYHGTKSSFDEFDPNKYSKSEYRAPAIFTSPQHSLPNQFSGVSKSGQGNELLLEKFPDSFKPQIMPLKQRGNLFDYNNPEHVEALLKANPDLENLTRGGGSLIENLKVGSWQAIENHDVQKAIRELGFDGFHAQEFGEKSTGLFNNTDVRSKFAHFNPKMAGVGAGSILSADLMAEETKPTESIWSSLMNTIGNVNQQQAQGTADIGAGAIEGTAGIAKMLATQPDLVAEVAGGGLLKAAGVVSPWIKGAGLGGVFYPSELGDGTLRDENGEYHPHVAQLKKEQQLDEYIASLTPDIHSTEIKLGR